MEVPRLGVKSELQLPAEATATAMQDLNHVYNLHHSSWQRRILNPLSVARNRTHNLMVTSRILFRCTTVGTPTVSPSYQRVLAPAGPSAWSIHLPFSLSSVDPSLKCHLLRESMPDPSDCVKAPTIHAHNVHASPPCSPGSMLPLPGHCQYRSL